MEKNISFDTFEYFLKCYFYISIDYEKVEKVTSEFIEIESKELTKKLLKELYSIKEMGDWEYIRLFMEEHAFRYYRHDRLKEMVDLMIRVLST